MTQNLRLVGSRTLTSSDSNVSSNFTLSAVNSSSQWCADETAACLDKQVVEYKGSTTNGYGYNWYTATAGTGTTSKTSGNMSSSICPKGWRLPTGLSSGEFQKLYNKYNSYALMTNSSGPAFTIYSNSDWNEYWSSTASEKWAADLALGWGGTSTAVLPANKTYRFWLRAVRCVAQ